MKKKGVANSVIIIAAVAIIVVVVAGIFLKIGPKASTDQFLTLEEASKIVNDNIINPDELTYHLTTYCWPELLENGDVVASYGNPDHSHVVEEDTWFFWINDFPLIGFSHPTRYVFVNASSGDYWISIEDWWPCLNGEGLWDTPEEYKDNKYLVFSSLTYSQTPIAM
ncbi:hypothetical protein AKJ58_00400, partial [candidate division MSBL1 archaeon SCGC-AAA385D11]